MLTRRAFLQNAAAAAGALAFPAVLRGAAPNGFVQVAVVGCKGQGLSDLTQIGAHPKVKFVAFCDVDTSRFDEADQRFPDVPHFQDCREMFDQLGDQIDAVQISTPDHWHAPIGLDALRRGKHVYCQKPLTHTVWEARQMRVAADRARVITQMGTQIHSAKEYRTCVKMIRDGVIGKIKEVHSWQGNRGNRFSRMAQRPADAAAPPPATLDWDLWLGPAPQRDYVPDLYAPAKWRDWQDFGSGTLGDFGCHILDPVFTALELAAPRAILADNDGTHPETWPGEETITYEFPGTKFTTGETLIVTWQDGGRQPAALAKLPADKKVPRAGSLFIGEGGSVVLPHIGMPRLYRDNQAVENKSEEVAGLNHYHVWIDAVLAGTRTSAGFHYGGPLTETVQLGNVATRLPGKKLEWDAEGFAFRNAPEASKLLTKQYRKGFEIPS
jgi:predicted dehydrogenase